MLGGIQSVGTALRVGGRVGLRPREIVPPAVTTTLELRQPEQRRWVGMKKKKKKKKSELGEMQSMSEQQKKLDLLLRAVDAPVTRPPEPATEEEAQKIKAIESAYCAGRFREHNEHWHNLNCKILMKKHAVNMLPRHSKVKEEALIIDDEPPPKGRRYITWTPPIKDFDPSQWDFEE